MKNLMFLVLMVFSLTVLSQKTIQPKDSYESAHILPLVVGQDLLLDKDTFLTYISNSKKEIINLYWKNKEGIQYKYFYDLNIDLNRSMIAPYFMCNGGMFMEDYSSLGLLIYEGKVIKPINKKSHSTGNFYKKPNGVFFINKSGTVGLSLSDKFVQTPQVRHAIQSGPMMIYDGEILPSCKNTTAECKRNGVGILPDGRVLFVLAMREVSMYSFAKFFKDSGCIAALFLDGGISDAYCPSKGKTLGATAFGTILVVSRR